MTNDFEKPESTLLSVAWLRGFGDNAHELQGRVLVDVSDGRLESPPTDAEMQRVTRAAKAELGRCMAERVNAVIATAPRGFKAEYERVACFPADAGALSDLLLLLVGYCGEPTTVLHWPLSKRVEAEVYAARVHSRASDNPVSVPPKPGWMPLPWGAEDGRGGHAPTMIDAPAERKDVTDG